MLDPRAPERVTSGPILRHVPPSEAEPKHPSPHEAHATAVGGLAVEVAVRIAEVEESWQSAG